MFAIAAAAASPSLADDQLHAVHVGEATAAAAAARSTQSAHTSNNQGQRAPSEVDDAEDNDGNQWTEESLKELKNKELQAILVGLGLRKTGNKKDLIDRILGREVVVDKRKKKIKWRNSKARAMLVRMLMDKDSNAHTMTWQQLHSSHEWFQEYDAKSFQRYVSELKKANPKKIAVVTEDNKIINAELQRFPRPDKTLRGEPFWDTHPSKRLLRQDVKLGKHLEMKPKTLHQTRLEYQAFSLKTFRQHVYQEKRHQKELPMRVDLITPLPTNVNVPKQSSSLEKMMGFIGLSSAKKSAAEGSEYQSPAPSSTSVKGTSKQKSWSNPRHLSGAFDVEAMSTASTVQTSGSKKNPPPPEKKRRNMSIQASTPPPPRRSTRNKKNKGGRVGSNK
ncbi:hypothetical protein QTG54_009586 [Skeletonema marinoi]|uniref:SAP domain-containing protein n=1 Tax=Skeletonema marinoi TaxID=267567 RepID=A0AAD9DA67_9STRA|nr:hypothetical protein QTG54_009586 [Skeletonema marinoi]|eukprot:scaffold37999_cov214-Skeletonema_marinoi.AAC.11